MTLEKCECISDVQKLTGQPLYFVRAMKRITPWVLRPEGAKALLCSEMHLSDNVRGDFSLAAKNFVIKCKQLLIFRPSSDVVLETHCTRKKTQTRQLVRVRHLKNRHAIIGLK